MRRALPLLFLIVLAFLSGCADKAVKLPGRPKFYKRVVSLSPGTTELVAINGDSQTLKGRSAACNYPPNIVGAIPVVASVKPDYEMIQGLKPDLIVYDKGLYSRQDIDKLKSTGADTFAIDANTVDDFIKQCYEMGSLLGWESRFNDYIQKIVTEEQTLQAAPFDPKPKVAIVMPGAGGQDYICGSDTFLGDVVRIAGGEMVGPKTSQFVLLNPETLVAANPDVIITNGSKTNSEMTVQQVNLILNDPRFKTVNAVKNKRVKPLDSDVLLRRGERVDDLMQGIHDAIAP